MGRPSHPEDLRAAAVGRIASGHSTREVAEAMGVHYSTVARWWYDAGGKSLGHRRKTANSKPSVKLRNRKWVEMYKRGLTTGQIAVKYGVRPGTVMFALQQISPTGRVKDLRRHQPQI